MIAKGGRRRVVSVQVIFGSGIFWFGFNSIKLSWIEIGSLLKRVWFRLGSGCPFSGHFSSGHISSG